METINFTELINTVTGRRLVIKNYTGIYVHQKTTHGANNVKRFEIGYCKRIL
jgi:Fe2+ transport system protein B